MKKFLFVFVFAFIAILSVWFSYLGIKDFTSPDASLSKEDQDFSRNLHDNLKGIGVLRKVSDLYQGDWVKVCINPVGAYSGLGAASGLEIIGNVDTYADDYVGGIYFITSTDKTLTAKYYRFRWDDIYVYSSNKRQLCFDKKSAAFKVTGTRDRPGVMVSPNEHSSKDFIELTIIDINGDK